MFFSYGNNNFSDNMGTFEAKNVRDAIRFAIKKTRDNDNYPVGRIKYFKSNPYKDASIEFYTNNGNHWDLSVLKKSNLTKEYSMAGLPRKYAKMGFKRGWKAYHAAHHYSTHRTLGMDGLEGRGKKHHRGKKVSVQHYLLGADLSAPAIVSRPVHRLGSITPGRVISPIIDLALIIAGMALGSKIKQWSPIKNPHLMNGTGAAIGIGGSLMVRNRFAKMPLIGVALQASIAEAKILWPTMMPIAGDDEVVYLPTHGDDEGGVRQIEVEGADERVGAVVVGEEGEDERVGAVAVGEEGEEEEGMMGEGQDA
jgi:hypothetical protein